MNTPLVSIVIPTRNRPDLLLSAVESALRQTLREIEVIVVIDGPDPLTVHALESVDDPRLRYIQHESSLGGNRARNRGIQEANGAWIAMLDDDDEWMPDKLAKQLAVANESNCSRPIIACRAFVNRGMYKEIWPTRKPYSKERIDEYIFCRAGVKQGESLLITSMLMAPRELFLQVPFDPKVRRHQDTDWVLRAISIGSARLLWAWEPLLIFNVEISRPSVSRSSDAAPSLDWMQGSPLLSPKAKAYFLSNQIAPRIRGYSGKLPKYAVIATVLRGTIRYPRTFLTALIFFVTTPQLRGHIRILRQRFAKKDHTSRG